MALRRAGRPAGERLGIVGQGLRDRQQRGPMVAGGAPRGVVVRVRRYACLCGAILTAVPRETLPARLYRQIELALSLPIYDGGLRSGLSEERGALVEQARANLEGGLRQAQSDVRVSFEAMLRADQALAASRDATRLAHRAYELATLAYRAGASTNIEVLDAARQARDADTAVAQAEDQPRQSRLDLLVAAGKFP